MIWHLKDSLNLSISAYDIAPEGQPELADISHDMPPETPVFYNKPDDERESPGDTRLVLLTDFPFLSGDPRSDISRLRSTTSS